MEDLAFLVGAILLGLVVLGAGSVVLAVVARTGKISRYWPLGAVVVLAILGLVAWQGSDRMGLVPLGLALVTLVITLWPKSEK